MTFVIINECLSLGVIFLTLLIHICSFLTVVMNEIIYHAYFFWCIYKMSNAICLSTASAMSQYAAASLPGYSWGIPQAASAAAAGTIPISPYQAAQPQLQEARMQ